MDQLNRPDVDAFKNLQKTPIIVVLDNVRSLHNVGSAFRTGDGFAIEKIMLCGITGTPPHREIEKTALGATQSITWSYHKDVAEAIQQAQAEGAKIVAIEQAEGSIPLQEFTISEGEKYALFLAMKFMAFPRKSWNRQTLVLRYHSLAQSIP